MKVDEFKGKKNISLALALSLALLMLTPVFSYSIPLSWVKNKTGGSIDADNDGMVDKAELIIKSNISSGLDISNDELVIGEEDGINATKEGLEVDELYMKTFFASLTKSEAHEETQGSIDTIKPEDNKKIDFLVFENDTYENGEDVYDFKEITSKNITYPGSVVVLETETNTKLEEGTNYEINYCTGEINITDLNTTAGDKEKVIIKYKYAPEDLSGNKTDGIIQTEYHPIVEGTLELTDDGTTLQEGECGNYEVLNYQAGKIKLWRYNKTTGPETVDLSYNWTDFKGEIYSNGTTLEMNVSRIVESIKNEYVLQKGDTMSGDLGLNGSEILNVNTVNPAGEGLKVKGAPNQKAGEGALNISSNYILNTPSIKGTSTQGLKAYLPFENELIDPQASPGDGDLDIVYKDPDGYLSYFDTGSSNSTNTTEPISSVGGVADIGNDKDMDMAYESSSGWLHYYDNGSKTSVNLSVLPSVVGGIADIGGDGDQDIVYNTGTLFLEYYDTGPGKSVETTITAYDVGGIADIGGDGDLDIALKDDNGNLKYFDNGSQKAIDLGVQVSEGRGVGGIADIGGDGDLDMAYINENDYLHYYDMGSQSPVNLSLKAEYVGGIADIEEDGSMDIAYVGMDGNLKYYDTSLEFSIDTGTQASGVGEIADIGKPRKLTLDWSKESNEAGFRKGPELEEGKVGKSYEFNGKDEYLSVQGHVTESNTTTLSAWVKASNTTGNLTMISIGDYIEVNPVKKGKEGEAFFYNGEEKKITNLTQKVDNGGWHHLAYVIGDNNQTIYMNGEEAGSSNYTDEVNFNKERQMNTLVGATWSENWTKTETWKVSSGKDWKKAEAEDKDAEVINGKLEIEQFWWILDQSTSDVYSYDSTWFYTGKSHHLYEDSRPTGITQDNEGNWWMVGDANEKVYKYDKDWYYKDVSKFIGKQETSPTDIFSMKDGEWRILGDQNNMFYRYYPDWKYKNSSEDLSDQDTAPMGIFRGREDNIWRLIGNQSDKIYEYETLGVSTFNEIDISNNDTEPTDIFQDGEGNWWIVGTENNKVHKYKVKDGNWEYVNNYSLGSIVTNPQDLYQEVSSQGTWTSEWHDWEKWVLPQTLSLWVNSTGGGLQVKVQTSYDGEEINGDTGWINVSQTGRSEFELKDKLAVGSRKARYTRVMFNMTRGPPTPEVWDYILKVKTKGKEDFWNGSIDEVRIYNRALNQNEVRTLYEKGRNRRQEIGGAWLPREGGKLYGDLDMNDNKITGFFASKCDPKKIITEIHANGSYKCEGLGDKLAEDTWVNREGDEMSGNLNMTNNSIIEAKLGVGTLETDQGEVQIKAEGKYDTPNSLHPLIMRGDSHSLYLGTNSSENVSYIQAYDIGNKAFNLSLNNIRGDVGIGTTSPKRKLHVAGDVLLDNNKALAWKNSTGVVKDIMKFNSGNSLIIDGHNYIKIKSPSTLSLMDPTGVETMNFDFDGSTFDVKGARITGVDTLTFDNNQIEIGQGSSSTGNNSVAVGRNAVASGNYSVAIGASASAEGARSIALGQGASATAERSIAIGRNSIPNTPNRMDIGSSSRNYDLNITGLVSADYIKGENFTFGTERRESIIKIKRIVVPPDYNSVNVNTTVDAEEWECTVGGFKAEGVDIYEGAANAGFVFYSFVYNSTWIVRCEGLNEPSNNVGYSFNLYCIKSEWVKTQGDWGKKPVLGNAGGLYTVE